MPDRGLRSEQATHSGFYLCRCTVCGREDRSGLTPLRDGWPSCCGYTMRLVESERFIASVDRQVGACVQGADVSPRTELPVVVVEALRLADRIEQKYPEPLEREEAQDALVQLARFVCEELTDA